MEIIIVVIAVIAVTVAIILLALLQLRIQKQNSRANSTTRITREQSNQVQVEEIAEDYPNDGILKTGPPPYRQVMKTPELYPLATSSKIENAEVIIQIPMTPKHNQRSKRTWNQLLNAVLLSDDLGTNTEAGKLTSNDNTPISRDSAVTDEALPTYDEVCPGNTPEGSKVDTPLPRRDSSDIVMSGLYNFLGFNFGIETKKLCRKEGFSTISSALQTVITEEQILPTRRPRLATL